MPDNPRKEAFKEIIMGTLRETGPRKPVPRDVLIARAQELKPELFDDEPCYPGCRSHEQRWRHEFDRSIYDLRSTRPPKIQSGAEKGTYQLA